MYKLIKKAVILMAIIAGVMLVDVNASFCADKGTQIGILNLVYKSPDGVEHIKSKMDAYIKDGSKALYFSGTDLEVFQLRDEDIPKIEGYHFDEYYADDSFSGLAYTYYSPISKIYSVYGRMLDLFSGTIGAGLEEKNIYAKMTPDVYEIQMIDTLNEDMPYVPIFQKYNDGFYKNSDCTTRVENLREELLGNNPNADRQKHYKTDGFFLGGIRLSDKYGNINLTKATFSEAQTTTYKAQATYTPNVYEIRLQKKGGVGGVDAIYEKYGVGLYSELECINLIDVEKSTASVPKKNGYEFLGYFIQEEYSGVFTPEIYPDGSYSSSLYTLSGGSKNKYKVYKENSSLYAAWDLLSYEIRVGNAGKSSTSDELGPWRYSYRFDVEKNFSQAREVYGTSQWKTICTIPKGQDFGGYWDKDYTTQYIDKDGNPTSHIDDIKYKNTTIYALWSPHYYEVSIKDEDKNTLYTIYDKYGDKEHFYYRDTAGNMIASTSVAVPKKDGYIFHSYNIDMSTALIAEDYIDKDGKIIFDRFGKRVVNYSLYPIFEEKEITIKLMQYDKTNDSEAVTLGTMTYNAAEKKYYDVFSNDINKVDKDKVAEHPDPHKVFVGFSDDPDGKGTKYINEDGTILEALSKYLDTYDLDEFTLYETYIDGLHVITLWKTTDGKNYVSAEKIYAKYGGGIYKERACTTRITNLSVRGDEVPEATFLGYASSDNKVNYTDEEGNFFMNVYRGMAFTSDMDIYPRWKKEYRNIQLIYYVNEDGVGVGSTNVYAWNKKLYLDKELTEEFSLAKVAGLKRENHTFAGFYTKQDGGVCCVSDAGVVSEVQVDVLTNESKLYGQWNEKAYEIEIVYIKDGKKETKNKVYLTYGDKYYTSSILAAEYNLGDIIESIPGYECKGAYINESGSGMIVNAKKEVMPSANTFFEENGKIYVIYMAIIKKIGVYEKTETGDNLNRTIYLKNGELYQDEECKDSLRIYPFDDEMTVENGKQYSGCYKEDMITQCISTINEFGDIEISSELLSGDIDKIYIKIEDKLYEIRIKDGDDTMLTIYKKNDKIYDSNGNEISKIDVLEKPGYTFKGCVIEEKEEVIISSNGEFREGMYDLYESKDLDSKWDPNKMTIYMYDKNEKVIGIVYKIGTNLYEDSKYKKPLDEKKFIEKILKACDAEYDGIMSWNGEEYNVININEYKFDIDFLNMNFAEEKMDLIVMR